MLLHTCLLLLLHHHHFLLIANLFSPAFSGLKIDAVLGSNYPSCSQLPFQCIFSKMPAAYGTTPNCLFSWGACSACLPPTSVSPSMKSHFPTEYFLFAFTYVSQILSFFWFLWSSIQKGGTVFLRAWRAASLGLSPGSLEDRFCQCIVSTIRRPSVPCRTSYMCKNPVFFLAAPCFSCSMWDLVPWPGIEPRSPMLGAWSLSHWTTGKSPKFYIFDPVNIP